MKGNYTQNIEHRLRNLKMSLRIAIKTYRNEMCIHGMPDSILRIICDITHSEELFTKQLQIREKKYNRMSSEQKRKLIEKQYKYVMGHNMNWNNPRTFSEKIQIIKTEGVTDSMRSLVDKYSVREWIKNTIGEEYLVPLCGVYKCAEEIEWESLPNQFCIKTNHGSAMNIVIKDKSTVDKKRVKSLIHAWMKRPFDMVGYEMQYQEIERKIIIEKYIEEIDGDLFDYKFHCINGEPQFIQCIGKRDFKTHTAYHDHFDLDWNRLNWNFECFERFPYYVERPRNLDKMIEIAKSLSKGFKYVRVDLYDMGEKVLFGEMTFTPGSGLYPYNGTWNYERDLWLGEHIG